MDVVQTLDGGRRAMHDPDELEEEQRERERRNKINADFQQFVRRVQVRAWGGPLGSEAAGAAGGLVWVERAEIPQIPPTSNRHPPTDTQPNPNRIPPPKNNQPQEMWERDLPDLNLEFDVPFRELAFEGVPHRSTVTVMPTVNCIVELTEMPFTVGRFSGGREVRV
jgi:hypothetical protein